MDARALTRPIASSSISSETHLTQTTLTYISWLVYNEDFQVQYQVKLIYNLFGEYIRHLPRLPSQVACQISTSLAHQQLLTTNSNTISDHLITTTTTTTK